MQSLLDHQTQRGKREIKPKQAGDRYVSQHKHYSYSYWLARKRGLLSLAFSSPSRLLSLPVPPPSSPLVPPLFHLYLLPLLTLPTPSPPLSPLFSPFTPSLSPSTYFPDPCWPLGDTRPCPNDLRNRRRVYTRETKETRTNVIRVYAPSTHTHICTRQRSRIRTRSLARDGKLSQGLLLVCMAAPM